MALVAFSFGGRAYAACPSSVDLDGDGYAPVPYQGCPTVKDCDDADAEVSPSLVGLAAGWGADVTTGDPQILYATEGSGAWRGYLTW